MKILTHLDLNQNELRNAVLQPLATAPSNAVIGQLYYDSTKKEIVYYDGIAWKTAGSSVEVSDNGCLIIDGQKVSVYELPIASDTQLGGIKVGAGLSINAETGVLSATGGGTADSVDWANITSKPEFSAVATSGSYNDLTDKPAIPSKLSQLTNDSNFVTDANYVHTDNNFTTEEKTKLNNIAAGAEVNVQSDWNITDETNDAFIKNKPTKLSEFANDSAFIDNTVNNLINYYTKNEVTDMVAAASSLKFEVVDALPAVGDASSKGIYLVSKGDKWANDVYNEYLFIESTQKFELIGNTSIDLSNYLQKNGDGSTVTVAFTTADARELPSTSETIAIIVGKIAKYLSDLSTVAFSGSYNDLTNKPAVYPHLTITQLTLVTGQTSVTSELTFTDSTISSVIARDATTGEVLLVDWKLNAEGAVVVEIAEAYANNIVINISYLMN